MTAPNPESAWEYLWTRYETGLWSDLPPPPSCPPSTLACCFAFFGPLPRLSRALNPPGIVEGSGMAELSILPLTPPIRDPLPEEVGASPAGRETAGYCASVGVGPGHKIGLSELRVKGKQRWLTRSRIKPTLSVTPNTLELSMIGSNTGLESLVFTGA
jgi:hypothetical protein